MDNPEIKNLTLRLKMAAIISILLSPSFLLAKISISYLKYNDSLIVQTAQISKLLSGEIKILELPPTWEIEIGLCGYENGEDIEYKIKETENNWNTANFPEIRYTNLVSGQHTFIIRQKQGEYYDEIALPVFFSIQKKMYYQLNLWNYILIAICLLFIFSAIVFLASLVRSRQNIQIEKVRNQIASDLHDDVGANLSAIKMLLDVLKKKIGHKYSEVIGQLLDKIQIHTQETLTNLQDTVWAINPLNDSVELLLKKMLSFAAMVLQAKEIALKIDDRYDPKLPQKLDMQQRHNLFLMFKEAVNNVAKHSYATKAEIIIQNSKNTLSIQIKDNGVGFDPGVEFSGNGLKNFPLRAKENFIDFALTSRPGQGTEVNMIIHGVLN